VNKVFLAYPFREENQRLTREIDRLVRSHGLALITAEVVGGEDLTAAIKDSLSKSDALIALLAKDRKFDGKEEWSTTDWVKSELTDARTRGQRAIAMIEKGVELRGLHAGNEYIPFDRKDPHEAFLRLSETIGLWKEAAGRFLEIRLVPEAAARVAAAAGTKCRCRIIQNGRPGEWQTVRARPKPGGVFVEIAGVKQGEDIEIELIEGEQAKWRSDESPQWVHIELKSLQ